jgi:hypothetical protein
VCFEKGQERALERTYGGLERLREWEGGRESERALVTASD